MSASSAGAVAVLICAGWLVSASAAAPTLLHVSPKGNDAWPGSRTRPFATLDRARIAVRERKAEAPGVPVAVRLGAGEYDLVEPFVLTPQDSGTEAGPVTWEAAPGERAVIRGCRKITGWQRWKGSIHRADLKQQGLTGIAFWQLFYKAGTGFSQRMELARHPNFDPEHPRSGGNVYAAGTQPGRKARGQLVYGEGDVPFDQWGDISQAEVVSTYNRGWQFAITPIKSVDRQKHIITVRECRGQFRKLNRYFIRNVLDALDAPGEWFLDRKSSVLYFWPPDGEIKGDVLAPVMDHIVHLDGSIPFPHGYLNTSWHRPLGEFPKPEGERQPVEHVRFVGLDFECARQDAIRMTGARRCEVVRCRVSNVGNMGINIGGVTSSFAEVGNPRVTPATGHPMGAGGGGQILLANDPGEECRVEGCDLWDIGCEGVMLYGAKNVAENCHVWDIGLYAKDCPCINLLGEGNVARRCTLHDCPRCAIFIKGNDNVAELNDVHHAVLETCDMGAIRFVNRNMHLKGNIVRHNLVRETTGYGFVWKAAQTFESPFYTWGIYLDDYTCGTQVVGNIVVASGRGGIMIHGGGDNLVANNIVVDAGQYQVEYAPIRDTKHYPNVFAKNRCERNVLVCTRPNSMPYRFTRPDHNMPSFAKNVIWAGGGKLIVGTHGNTGVFGLDAWLKKGFDKGSIVADPKLVDRGNRVYELAPDSPAWAMGFKPIPIERIGCYQSGTRVSWPVEPNWERPREDMVLHHEPGAAPRGMVFPEIVEEVPIGPIRVDFEKFEVGKKPATGDIMDDPRARMVVTDEVAASGTRCLRVADAPGLRHPWLPRVYWPFEFRKGTVVFGVDLRIDGKQPAKLYIDPRQYSDTPGREYFSGPMINVEPDGSVRSPSGVLTKVPMDTWFRVEMRMALGDKAAGKSDVTVTVKGQAPRRFSVKNGHPKFQRLERVVISSLSTTKSLFWVDNIVCGPE